MVPAAVAKQRQQAQIAALREQEAQHMSRAQRLANPKESKTLASLQTPAVAARPAPKPMVAPVMYPMRPAFAIKRTDLAPNVDGNSDPPVFATSSVPSDATKPSIAPPPTRSTSVFFSASSRALTSTTPVQKEDKFADFMKDLGSMGAFDG
jgi:hypothetical protein